jgi:N-acetylglucosamine malate deacetylase 1
MNKKIIVVAPHPDDEVLGVGGNIARLSAEGHDIFVLIMTKGCPPLYDKASVDQVRAEAKEAHGILGVRETIYLDFKISNHQCYLFLLLEIFMLIISKHLLRLL